VNDEKLACSGKDPKKLGPFSLSGQTAKGTANAVPLFNLLLAVTVEERGFSAA